MLSFLDLRKQTAEIEGAIREAISGVLEKGDFIGGHAIAEFQSEFAAYLNAGGCLAVANGTDALEIVLAALELPPGSEIIVPANSFIATAEAVITAGHKVVFSDCDDRTYTMSVESLRRAITPRTRAIIPVHLYGQPCEMEPIMALAKEHNLEVIEDCAQAHGAEYRGKKVGTFGRASTFSFYPGKNLGAFGDAGAIVSNDLGFLESCRMIANHGRRTKEKYLHHSVGRNSRLDTLQAAVLRVKLTQLDKWLDHRRLIADAYQDCLSEISGLVLPKIPAETRHSFHLYVIQTDFRERVMEALKLAHIGYGIHYPLALPNQPAFKGIVSDCPVSTRLESKILSLPIGEHMVPADTRQVATVLREVNV
jgi:dTDP-4-amino-4,6-dideoxygalactose transaminase